ncbi:hypothetical protein [Nitrosopumilus sp.]|uniref:hypothetical protein n=1 Tax=Nitrosopumilus sp. TaxID=2024843 RepID=UPI003D0E3B68
MNVLIIFALVFAFLVPTTAFGAQGYFEGDYGKQVSQAPIVCVFQPNDSRIDERKWEMWYADAKRGIDNWRAVLEQSGSGTWDITVKEVPLNKLDLLNRDVCDITVEFVDRPYIQDGRYANALGWWLTNTKITKVVYSSFEYCGVEYDPQFDIFVNSICFDDKFERSKFMASVVQHEFGHALGLGHYIAYNRISMQDWYDTGTGYPSIMTPMPPNEELKTITQEDIEKVREIYGPKGFGERTNFTPLFDERVIQEPKVYTSEKTGIEIYKDKPRTKTIQGDVPDKLYKRGVLVDLIIERPDGKVDHKGLSVSKTLKKYKTQLTFGESDPAGTYKITHKFNGKEFYKEEIIISKSNPTYKSSNTNISKNIDKDTDNDGIKDSSDFCKTKPETYNGYRDTDGCPDKKQVVKAKTPIFTTQQKNMMTQKINTSTESLFKLKEGMNITWKYLDDANSKYTDYHAKKHVEKAWDLYNKLYDQRVTSGKFLERTISDYLHLQDQTKTSEWNHYKEFVSKFDKINSNISKIGSDMKYVSQELDYAEKSQNKIKEICVSWWC